ncbi:MAG: hypothetical protein R3F34_04085 [Planctomycetota bacterium]
MPQRSSTPIVVTAVLVLLVAIGASFFLLSDDSADRGPELATKEAAEKTKEVLGDVELAGSAEGAATEAAVSKRERVAPEESVAAPEEEPELDGRTWGDLLLAVDDADGKPIEEAFVLHVDAKGVLRRRGLDAKLRAHDLDEGTFAALDSELHAPRFFVPSDLSTHVGGPAFVRLAPAGRIRVEFDGELDGEGPMVSVSVVDPTVGGGFEDETDGQQAEALSKTMRRMVSESAEEKWRRRQSKWYARNETARSYLVLTGEPPFRGYSADVVATRSFPLVFEDVPVDAEVAVSAWSDLNVEVEPPEQDGWSMGRSAALEIEKGGTATVVVRGLGTATLLAAIPADAEAGHFRLIRRVGENGWLHERDEDADEKGRIRFDDVAPRVYVFEATWRGFDGTEYACALDVELHDGEVRDLGVLQGDADSKLTVVPVFVVDGEELDPGAAARFAEAEWNFFLSAVDDDGPSNWKSIDDVRCERQVVGGLKPTKYWFSHGMVELPEDLAGLYRYEGADPLGQIDLAETSEITVRLLFSSGTPCDLTVTVPGSDSSTPRFVSGVALPDDRHAQVWLQFEEGWSDTSRTEWTVGTRAMLSPGDWTFHVVVHPNVESNKYVPGKSVVPPSWYGTTRLHVGDGAVSPIAMRLDLAAALVVEQAPPNEGEERDGSQHFGLTLFDEDVPLVSLWSAWTEGDGPFVVTGLPPGATMVDVTTNKEYRIGAAGTALDVRR